MITRKIIRICVSIIIGIYYCALLSNAQKITVFSDHYSQGSKVDISISQCSNLPDELAGAVTSINTQDNCTRFYDAKNCTGNSIEVMPRSPFHHNLHFWDFNDKTVSVGPCPEACDKRVTGEVPDEDEQVSVTLYTRKIFKGAYHELNIQGCIPIPTKFIFQLLSVRVFDKCIQFYNNVECKSSGPNVDTIELRRGTPSHDDITRWWFPEARAVSHCSFKCNETLIELHSNSKSNESTASSPRRQNEVILFDAQNYAGNWKSLIVERCMDVLNEWEGVAVSVKTFNKSCVSLYDKRGCSGDYFNVHGNNPDLSTRNFDSLARSLQPCTTVSSSQEPKEPEDVNNSSGKSEAYTSSTISPFIISTIVILPLFGVLTSKFLVLLIMKRCNPYRNIMEKLSEKEIDEFLQGLGMDLANNVETGGEPDGDYSVELLAQNRPYNDAYEILRSNIKFDPKTPLGMGEFGVVYKGSAQVMSVSENGGSSKVKTIQVAVKTVKPSSSVQCLRSLLKEVKIMLFVGKHDSIVHLIGCCTENLRKGLGREILVLMEFCPRGSLEGFLQKNRDNYRNVVKKGRVDLNKFNNGESEDLEVGRSGYQNLETAVPANYDFFQLLRWCIEIADGMEFLGTRKVIHSDLAARNVLLDDNFRAKISDFGLSRQLYCYTQYVKKRQEPLPWRWLAIESLKSMEFSSKSDVWSFGILTWEIFTLGEKPYPGVVWSDDFLRNLQDGLRLSKPKYAVSECYNLMIQCWGEDPNNRPSFSEILIELRDIYSSLKPSHRQSNPVLKYSNIIV